MPYDDWKFTRLPEPNQHLLAAENTKTGRVYMNTTRSDLNQKIAQYETALDVIEDSKKKKRKKKRKVG
jgi:hypothetical protein